jgi:hypothetical protein
VVCVTWYTFSLSGNVCVSAINEMQEIPMIYPPYSMLDLRFVLDVCFLFISYLAYNSTLKMETIRSPEISVYFYRTAQ